MTKSVPASAALASYVTTTVYDSAGRVSGISDTLGHALTNSCDTAGRLLSVEPTLFGDFSHNFEALL